MKTFGALMLIIILAVGAVLFIETGSRASNNTGSVDVIVVEPGDTLWKLAVRAVSDTDPRWIVDQIMELNDLKSPLIAPGQALLVPVSS